MIIIKQNGGKYKKIPTLIFRHTILKQYNLFSCKTTHSILIDVHSDLFKHTILVLRHGRNLLTLAHEDYLEDLSEEC